VWAHQDCLEDSGSQRGRWKSLAGWVMPLTDTIGEAQRRRGCGTIARKILPALGGTASPGEQ
jgi:hypothetical protein